MNQLLAVEISVTKPVFTVISWLAAVSDRITMEKTRAYWTYKAHQSLANCR